MQTTTSAFARFWALGYHRIVPVIPPDAAISEASTLYKRVGTRQDARGKLPGVKGHNGLWHSWDWTQHVTDPEDFERWRAMGAGVGIVTGDGLLAIDADTVDEDHAKTIRDIIKAHMGTTPIRVGRYPKALYPIRVTDPYAYRRIDFGPKDERGNQERVEILSDRKFFVAEGIHPKTGKPYTWPRELVPYDDLPLFTPDQIDAMMAALKSALPKASKVAIEGGGDTPTNQSALRGEPATIRRAVQATPNTSDHFPTREAYRDFGYAIKAAVEDEREAYDIWAEWCHRWEEGENDDDIMQADWRRMKPPFRRGAGWLYETAERTSKGEWTEAMAHFDPIPESVPSPFDAQTEKQVEARTDVYPLLSIEDLQNRPPPTFLIDRHFPDNGFGFIYSDPGVGKSFYALDACLSVAHGLPDWHGDKITTDPETYVLYIATEGGFDLGNRIKAWHKARGIENFTKRFLVLEQTLNFMKQDDVDKLLRTVASVGKRLCMAAIDTVSRTIPGANENAQDDMTLFVSACSALREAQQCLVIGVHHSNKLGSAMRGSTVLAGAADFIFKLTRKKPAMIGRVTCEKMKAVSDGWSYQIAFGHVDLGGGYSSLVANRSALPGGNVGPAGGGEAAVLGAVEEAWAAGDAWSRTYHGGERFAVRRMIEDHGYTSEGAEKALDGWCAEGVLVQDMVSKKSKRMGLRVAYWPALDAAGCAEGMPDMPDRHTDGGGVFE